ncbi:MAG: hypothetical protein Q6365_018475, partial [Candidatus Sigynarchaeota archaeon]
MKRRTILTKLAKKNDQARLIAIGIVFISIMFLDVASVTKRQAMGRDRSDARIGISDGWICSWESRAWGGNMYDEGNDITVTTDGIYFCGKTTSYGGGTHMKAFLAKLDLAGNRLWNYTWSSGLNTDDQFFGIIASANGLYVAAASDDMITHNRKAYLIKYSYSGSLLWSQIYNGSNRDDAFGVAEDSDGVYLTGSTLVGKEPDVFIAKYSSTGTKLWNRTWGESGGDYVRGTVTVGTDGVYLVGNTYNWATLEWDTFIVKYSSTGTKLWNHTRGGSANDFATGVSAGLDGIYVTGSTRSVGETNTNAFLAKYSSSGVLLWNRTWGGMNYDIANYVAASLDGVYIAGYTESFGASRNDAFLAKYNSLGTQLWNRTWGGYNDEDAYGVAAASDGVYITGLTESFGNGGDAFIDKYDPSGNQPPSITRPADLSYVEGQTGRTISWVVK